MKTKRSQPSVRRQTRNLCRASLSHHDSILCSESLISITFFLDSLPIVRLARHREKHSPGNTNVYSRVQLSSSCISFESRWKWLVSGSGWILCSTPYDLSFHSATEKPLQKALLCAQQKLRSRRQFTLVQSASPLCSISFSIRRLLSGIAVPSRMRSEFNSPG